MKENKSDQVGRLQLKAGLPKAIGSAAIVLLLATIGFIGYSAYRSRSNPDFRMRGFPTTLSKDVVAVINGYERKEMDGDHARYVIRADRATSFADNHQELENVHMEVFDTASSSDKITAEKAVYIPGKEKYFIAYFAGAVNIETRDQLRVKTEQLTYSNQDEIALAEELIEFERLNVNGRSVGASVNARDKVLHLNKEVEIHSEGKGERSDLKAGSAVYDQLNEKIELIEHVAVEVASSGNNGQPALSNSFTSEKATAYLTAGEGDQRVLGRVELSDAVRIESRNGKSAPTNISANYALYEKSTDRFQLRDAVHIVTSEDERTTEIRADNVVYERRKGLVDLRGNASVVQDNSFVQGRLIHAELTTANRLKLAEIQDNAIAKQSSAERTTEVSGAKIKAVFGDDGSIANAAVGGAATAILVPVTVRDYTRLSMAAANSINVDFKGGGLLERILTEGRTKLRLEVPNRSPEAANKELSADRISTSFQPAGNDIMAASAVGKAELIVVPLNDSETAFRTTVSAPRFDCDFFPTGNDLKICTGSSKTRTVRIPLHPTAERGTQNISADKLVAAFGDASHELESLNGIGNAKFSELERNASAERMSYTAADQTVRLRGGEPTAWDNKSRAKAPEIDWDTKNQFSELRGGASTTYYSSSSLGNTAPFGRAEKPVYVTATAAHFDHKTDVATFSGNARGWQDNNYVRGERMTFSEREGRFVAEDNVHSLLYEARRAENGVEANQPIYVTAQKLTYLRDNRQLRYENNVDIRQGKDRITGGAANVFLNEHNSPERTEIEQNVIMTQPNRRATGSYARYEASGELLYLKGEPATVEDAEQGRSQGAEIRMNLKENRFTSQTPARTNSSARTRSVYKVKSN